MKQLLKKIQWKPFLYCLLAPLIVGALGAIFTNESIPTWYGQLKKPFFSPPNWVFGPVWTTLYILMGIASYLVWIKDKPKEARKDGIKFYQTQLMLNGMWSIVFFGLRSPLTALLVILALLAGIWVTIREFKKVDIRAAYLLYPYLAWVSFATLLNTAIVLLNR